jgi:hypothetical protein
MFCLESRFGSRGTAQSVWRLAMGWTIGVRFPVGVGTCFFDTVSRLVLGPTQPPIQWVPGDLSLALKRLGSEVYHSPTFSAEVKKYVELYLHSPNTSPWRSAKLSTGATLRFLLSLFRRFFK